MAETKELESHIKSPTFNFFVYLNLLWLKSVPSPSILAFIHIKLKTDLSQNILIILCKGLQLILMIRGLDANQVIQSPYKSLERNSCSTSFSDDCNEIEDRIGTLDLELENQNCPQNMEFHPLVIQSEITGNLLKKAVQFLFNLCWIKDLSQETLWEALMIFYSFKAKRIIKKIDLQRTVSVCALLSCKLFEQDKLSVKEILKITNGKYSLKQIISMQEEIISVLGFDLYIRNNISMVKCVQRLEQEDFEEFSCLAELLMMKGSEVFWKRQLLRGLTNIVRGVGSQDTSEIRGQLMGVCKGKEGEAILRKYSSKFDTERLVEKLQKY